MQNTFPGFVHVRGAREHNLKNIDLDIPARCPGRLHRRVRLRQILAGIRHAVRGSATALSGIRRALRPAPLRPDGRAEVDAIDGLPPAVALQQQRGSPTTRSSVGSVSTLSNLLRMLYSRAGTYPPHQPHLEAESFSTNTPEGACPQCHGLGRIYDVTERSMVPDDSLTIRQRAIAAWPTAWGGQNQRDILVSLGYDVDRPVARPSQERSRLDPLHRRAAHRPGLRRLHARPKHGAPSSAKRSPVIRALSPASSVTSCTLSPTPRAH